MEETPQSFNWEYCYWFCCQKTFLGTYCPNCGRSAFNGKKPKSFRDQLAKKMKCLYIKESNSNFQISSNESNHLADLAIELVCKKTEKVKSIVHKDLSENKRSWHWNDVLDQLIKELRQ